MKVLVLSNYYPEHIGGIEYVAQNLVFGYREHGFQVRWGAGDLQSCPHESHVDDIPFSVNNFTEEKLGFPYPLPSLTTMSQFISHVKWCDVVHLHGSLYAANIATFLLAQLLRKPVLITQHVGYIPYQQHYKLWLQKSAYYTISRYLLSRANQTIFVSYRVQNWFNRFVRFYEQSKVLMNGVDLQLFKPESEEQRATIRHSLGIFTDKPILLFVGRFVEKKGILLLKSLIEKDLSYFWILIGRRGDVDPTSWHSENLQVLAPQPQEKLQQFYAAADLLILPSIGEGFPLVAQEAMACGTPVMLSNETIQHMPDDIPVFDTLPTEEAITKNLARFFLQHQKKSQHIRQNISNYARQKWDWRTVSQTYINIILKLGARKL